MKRNRLLSKITLGVACLLGVGGAITAISVNNSYQEARADDPVSEYSINRSQLARTTLPDPWIKNDLDYNGSGDIIIDKNIAGGTPSDDTLCTLAIASGVSHMKRATATFNFYTKGNSFTPGSLGIRLYNGDARITEESDNEIVIEGDNEFAWNITTGNDSIQFQFYSVNGSNLPAEVYIRGRQADPSLYSTAMFTVSSSGTATIEAGTGVQSVYLSTNYDATSGDPSGTEYPIGTQVYAFAVMEGGYWIDGSSHVVQGGMGQPGTILRVGGQYITGANVFGTINAVQLDYPIEITHTSGCSSGYLSTSPNATSGYEDSHNFHYGDTVYGYVVMRDGYIAPNDWELVQGTTNHYCVGSISVTQLEGEGFYRVGPISTINLKYYNDANNQWETLSSFTAREGNSMPYLYSDKIPQREGYTFTGYHASYSGDQGTGSKYYNADGTSPYYYWDGGAAVVNMYASFTKDITVTINSVDTVWDDDWHGISVNVVDPASGYTIMYGTTPGSYISPEPQVYCDSGTYYIYVRITATNYTTYEGVGTIRINKADTVVDPVPTAKTGLVYTDQDQELINAGDVDYGSILYAVSNELAVPPAGDFSGDIPTGHDVGTYYVFYKSTGDSDHNSYPASVDNAITVKINQVDKSALASLIDKVDHYIDGIAEKYSDIADALNSVKTIAKTNGYDNPNVTATVVAQYVSDLQEALSNAKVDVTEEKIKAIGEVSYNSNSKALIDDARNYYDNELTNIEKGNVDEYLLAELEAAEALYGHVDGSVKEVLALDPKDSKDYRDAVATAKNNYNNLTQGEKDIYPEDVKKLLDDNIAILPIIDEISGLAPIQYNAEYKAKVAEVRKDYEALSEAQKEIVKKVNYDELTRIENGLSRVDNAYTKINNIGNVEYTEACKTRIDEARAAYDALTKEEKALVDNNTLNILLNAEAIYNSINYINNIGTIEANDACLKRIQDARNSYNSLTEAQKEAVGNDNLQTLIDAEKVYEALCKVKAIGDVSYSDESKERIEEARRYYESLTDAQKAKYGGVNLEVLENDEATFTKLESTGKAVSISLLILMIILFLAGGFVLFLILKNRKNNEDDDNQGGNGKGKKGEVKALSFSIIAPAILASLYGQGAFVVLYIFIGLAVLVWATDIVLFFLFKPKGMKAFDYCKYLFNKTFRKNKVEEPLPVKEEVKEEVEEKVVPQVDEESGDEEVVTVTDSKGNIFQIRFIKSFTAKIIQASEESKKYYEELKNYVLSYKGTTSRISWNYDSINSGRNPVVKFGVRGKTLCVYYPLDADQYNDTKYKVEKIDSKKFESVPTMYRIKNDRRLGYAKDLIDTVMASLSLLKGEEKHESYILPYEENKPLVARGLIKELKVQVNKPAEVVLDKKVNAEGDEIIHTKDAKGNIFEIRFIKSFTAKLSQSSDEVKNQYNELKNYVLGYKKANSRVSWHFDSINVGREQALKFSIRGKTLCLYYALNADELDDKYKVEKSEAKKYEAVPCLYRIKNERRFSYAKELIDQLMKKYGLEKGKESHEDFRIPYEETNALLA